MRGVTLAKRKRILRRLISTHTPHARRDVLLIATKMYSQISTHTPHARRDGIKNAVTALAFTFLLTRLMRGVTKRLCMRP